VGGNSAAPPHRTQGDTVDQLIESLKTLIKQSTEALGSEAPSTLMLKQQLAAALAKQESARKVFWMQAAQSGPGTDDKKV
jgi:hypothetical protein